MNSDELRNVKRGQETAAGSLEQELGELQKVQEDSRLKGIETVTVTCNAYFTIICC